MNRLLFLMLFIFLLIGLTKNAPKTKILEKHMYVCYLETKGIGMFKMEFNKPITREERIKTVDEVSLKLSKEMGANDVFQTCQEVDKK